MNEYEIHIGNLKGSPSHTDESLSVDNTECFIAISVFGTLCIRTTIKLNTATIITTHALCAQTPDALT